MTGWDVEAKYVDSEFIARIPLTTSLRDTRKKIEAWRIEQYPWWAGRRIQKMGYKLGAKVKWWRHADEGRSLGEMGVFEGFQIWMRVDRAREGECAEGDIEMGRRKGWDGGLKKEEFAVKKEGYAEECSGIGKKKGWDGVVKKEEEY